MRNLLNPKWIFLINTFPIVLAFFLLLGEFQVFKALLSVKYLVLWKQYGIALGLLGSVNVGYAIYLNKRKQKLSIYYGFISLACYFAFFWGLHSVDLVPSSIPNWMVPGDLFLYLGTFLMPTLLHSLLVIIFHVTPLTKEQSASENFILAVLIPITWIFLSLVTNSVTQYFFKVHFMLFFIITGTLFCLFFLFRGLFIMIRKRGKEAKDFDVFWKVVIAIMFPLIGLLLNNMMFADDVSQIKIGFFGNFHDPWYYILAAINGLLICIPNPKNERSRLILFLGRNVTFSYTFYFCLVFLPLLPFSVFAIILLGAGFLMLTPLMLFLIHVNTLFQDFAYLKSYFTAPTLWTFAIISFLVIPLCMTQRFVHDRITLHESLAYVYSPSYNQTERIDQASLRTTLNTIKHNKSRGGGAFGVPQPFISSYYNWIVLDHLALSDAKINTLEKIFLGKGSTKVRSDFVQNAPVELTHLSTQSTYDSTQKAWKSWIELELTNQSTNTQLAEYTTTFELPEGAWISDYYLYVGDRKERGILAEKKSAMWVYANIRNRNRDPGILYYLGGNKVAFRVFPFAKDEVRKTGIELLHKDPIQFSLDGNMLSLGTQGTSETSHYENEQVIYVSAQQKQTLPRVKRNPYFHFIVNAAHKDSLSLYAERMTKIAQAYPELSAGAKITFTSSYTSTANLTEDWQNQFPYHRYRGGFYADRAIKEILFNTYQAQADSFPIMVLVTDSIGEAVFDKNYSDWIFAYPESDRFYHLQSDAQLAPYSFHAPTLAIGDSLAPSFEYSVLAYPLGNANLHYLPADKQASFILKSEVMELEKDDIKEKNWDTALRLAALWRTQLLHPETSDKAWLKLVKHSFLSRVMTPVTSYIAVENEAQKAILKKKQSQVLAGNKNLDTGEEAQRMSEPGLMMLVLVLAFIFYLRKRKQAHQWVKRILGQGIPT